MKTDFSIYLPADSIGRPDWDYMESYVHNLETKVEDSLSNFRLILDSSI